MDVGARGSGEGFREGPGDQRRDGRPRKWLGPRGLPGGGPESGCIRRRAHGVWQKVGGRELGVRSGEGIEPVLGEARGQCGGHADSGFREWKESLLTGSHPNPLLTFHAAASRTKGRPPAAHSDKEDAPPGLGIRQSLWATPPFATPTPLATSPRVRHLPVWLSAPLPPPCLFS